jgi:deoxyhypusine synthase
MNREKLLSESVKDFRVDGASLIDIAERMRGGGGFGAKNFAEAVDILEAMGKDEKCFKFLSFPACIISTGLRGVIAELVEKGLVDAIITTCGTLDHDLAKAWGGKYYHGHWNLDDAQLKKANIARLGNLLLPEESYGVLIEKRMKAVLTELAAKKTEWSSWELIHEFGKRIDDPSSILHQAAKRNVPVFVPGITDGAFGSNLFWFSQEKPFKLDILADEKRLAEIAFHEKTTGALMLGGGISKHHTIWWNLYKGGLDYAVYVTTATQYDGSLSGARLEEAVSWGKVKPTAKYTTVDGDVTLLLPFMLATLYARLEKNRK